MVYLSSVSSNSTVMGKNVSFKQDTEEEQIESAKLLYKEQKNNPILTKLKIEGYKLKKAYTEYPEKGFSSSKNSNFHEYLEMGEKVAFPLGCATMIAIPNIPAKFFANVKSKCKAAEIGRKMGMGVILYAAFKNLSKYLIETPVNLKYGIDVNLYYKKKINELPEERNLKKSETNKDGNLVSYEYHKAFESADFPYWDLFYDNKDFGKERNAYFNQVGKKMGFSDEDLENSDQKVKPIIKEKLVQIKAFSTMVSYFAAAMGVGMAAQDSFAGFSLPSIRKLSDVKTFMKSLTFGTGRALSRSFKDFIGTDKMSTINYIMKKYKHQAIAVEEKPTAANLAGRGIFAAMVGLTLLGNFLILKNVNKDKGVFGSSKSAIDESKEKVVC